MIKKIPTDCCALAQLSISNDDSLESIKNKLDQMREEKESQSWWGTDKTMGQQSVFVITTPNEETLANNLLKLDFKRVHYFNRRKGYPQTGRLTMWIKNL